LEMVVLAMTAAVAGVATEVEALFLAQPAGGKLLAKGVVVMQLSQLALPAFAPSGVVVVAADKAAAAVAAAVAVADKAAVLVVAADKPAAVAVDVVAAAEVVAPRNLFRLRQKVAIECVAAFPAVVAA